MESSKKQKMHTSAFLRAIRPGTAEYKKKVKSLEIEALIERFLERIRELDQMEFIPDALPPQMTRAMCNDPNLILEIRDMYNDPCLPNNRWYTPVPENPYFKGVVTYPIILSILIHRYVYGQLGGPNKTPMKDVMRVLEDINSSLLVYNPYNVDADDEALLYVNGYQWLVTIYIRVCLKADPYRRDFDVHGDTKKNVVVYPSEEEEEYVYSDVEEDEAEAGI